ncbi:TetR family transcriptional regulator [Paenibacillus cellulosilyticus]|uniref:TetR family transcriptional regulator n=1 Tax=Paenibacillus cellulosilyticus TaxID=375489 RepID=A0A2V2YLP6_9BACL|nr:TetR-like C-terminal domain-containing protein [Paenibacillus cellulosilyticus]PWV95175.1 TetR family transcriptional regulator [Paenibacillus cellulosilyticus]QKS46071.1 WHG domain-containing protein [Paenibacillus cellulosilyticus]
MSPRVGLDDAVIMQAAATIADETGLQSVTLATLAKQLNVRPPSLYNHVNGLPEIRNKLTLLGLQGLHEAMQEALSKQKQSDSDAVPGLAIAYAQYAMKHPGLYEATININTREHTEEIQQKAAELVELVSNGLRPYLSSAVEAEIIHAVRGFRSLLHGYTSLILSGGFNMAIDRDESFRYMIRAYIAGIQKS